MRWGRKTDAGNRIISKKSCRCDNRLFRTKIEQEILLGLQLLMPQNLKDRAISERLPWFCFGSGQAMMPDPSPPNSQK
jgi:hypothetical protein